MSADAVDVWSDLSICIEVGLKRGVYSEAAGDLGPGPDHRAYDLCPGVNRGVPRDIIGPWLRINRFLECVKKRRIRIVESEQPAVAAA